MLVMVKHFICSYSDLFMLIHEHVWGKCGEFGTKLTIAFISEVMFYLFIVQVSAKFKICFRKISCTEGCVPRTELLHFGGDLAKDVASGIFLLFLLYKQNVELNTVAELWTLAQLKGIS